MTRRVLVVPVAPLPYCSLLCACACSAKCIQLASLLGLSNWREAGEKEYQIVITSQQQIQMSLVAIEGTALSHSLVSPQSKSMTLYAVFLVALGTACATFAATRPPSELFVAAHHNVRSAMRHPQVALPAARATRAGLFVAPQGNGLNPFVPGVLLAAKSGRRRNTSQAMALAHTYCYNQPFGCCLGGDWKSPCSYGISQVDPSKLHKRLNFVP